MKKLILSAALILGGLTYTEVTADAVPAAVKSTIEKSFPGTKLEKAYKNDKNEYKLEISKEGKKYTFFTDASGNIIKK